MLVWRVEHRDGGHGPYRPEPLSDSLVKFVDKLCEKHDSDPERITPFHDPVLRYVPYDIGLVFGFRTLRELKWWFEGFHEDLKAHGYVVRRYSVRKEFVTVGTRQLTFFKDEAELIDTREAA